MTSVITDPNRNSSVSITDYLGALVALFAIVIGVFGDTWDPARTGLQRVTATGWFTLLIGLGGFALSIWQARKARLEANWQNAKALRIQTVASAELAKALDRLEGPLHLLHERGPAGMSDYEEFRSDLAYRYSELRSTRFLTHLGTVDLREDSGVYPVHTWCALLHDAAQSAFAQIDSAIAKFGPYLDSDALVSFGELQHDEFFEMRLRHIMILVEANSRMPRYPISFAFSGPDEFACYQRFIERLAKARAYISLR